MTSVSTPREVRTAGGGESAPHPSTFAPNEFAASDHDPIVIGFNPLLGDFDDDGELDWDDRTALLGAIHRGDSPDDNVDRRMDLTGDGRVRLRDYIAWLQYFVVWKKGQP